MEREGFLADPAVRLMRLNDQVWRACRVVIDVELHLGVMDLPAAIDFLSAEAHMNRHEAELECRRYAEEPGQAMSYLLGKREVMSLAEAYRERRAGASSGSTTNCSRGDRCRRRSSPGGWASARAPRRRRQFLTLSRCSAPWSTTWSRPAALAR